MYPRSKRLSAVSLAAMVAMACAAGTARAQGVAPPAPSSLPALDPETPLAPLPGLGVDWPDLNARDPLEAAPVDLAAADPAATPRYDVALEGVDELPVVRRRFDELSVLRDNEGKTANAAQIDRRARDDVDLLETIMRSEGYYDATVDSVVTPAPAGGRVQVTLRVAPGALYKFDEVAVTGLTGDAAPLRPAYPVAPETPVVAEDVIAAQATLREKLGRTGFPFAKVGEPAIVVDHETRAASLDLAVDPGGKRDFGAIVMTGGNPPFDARHMQVIARFKPGDLYDEAMVDDLRRAIVATGLVSQVRIAPVEGKTPGTVDIATTLDPAPFRTLSGEAGFGTSEGIRIEASWQHRNFIRPEGAVTFRGIAGTREQLAGALLRMSNFRRRDQVLNARALASHQNTNAYEAFTFELGGSIERQTTILWQKPWSFSIGAELIASNQRNVTPESGTQIRRTFFIGAVPLYLQYDGSDSLLDPTRGYRLAARVSPEASFQGSAFGYVRTQYDASGYLPVGGRTVLAGRVRIGATAGASRDTIAPSRLFYAGGGGSVRGYGYQLIGPRNQFDQPLGGRSLAELSIEARVRLPVFGGNFGVVPFVDAGNVYESVLPRFTGLRVGVGAGLRYYSNFGPIRIDVGTPLGRRASDPLLSVQVSLGQAF